MQADLELKSWLILMQAANAEEILVPMITWTLDGQRINADAGDVQQSLQAIRDYSVFQVTSMHTDMQMGPRLATSAIFRQHCLLQARYAMPCHAWLPLHERSHFPVYVPPTFLQMTDS